MFFAEASNGASAMQIGLWVICATAVLQGVVAVLGIANFFRKRVERREVTLGITPVSVEEFKACQAERKREQEMMFSKIGGVERGTQERVGRQIEELRKERAEDMGGLRREVTEIGKQVSGLERETEIQNQRLAQIDAKLDRVIERKTFPR